MLVLVGIDIGGPAGLAPRRRWRGLSGERSALANRPGLGAACRVRCRRGPGPRRPPVARPGGLGAWGPGRCRGTRHLHMSLHDRGTTAGRSERPQDGPGKPNGRGTGDRRSAGRSGPPPARGRSGGGRQIVPRRPGDRGPVRPDLLWRSDNRPAEKSDFFISRCNGRPQVCGDAPPADVAAPTPAGLRGGGPLGASDRARDDPGAVYGAAAGLGTSQGGGT